jgi:hypothetical protein
MLPLGDGDLMLRASHLWLVSRRCIAVIYHPSGLFSCGSRRGAKMAKLSKLLERYWSLATAILLPVIELLTEGLIRLFVDYEVSRAVLSVVCIALLIHSWFMQRRYANSKWRLAFFRLLLSLVALGPVWLGLNVMRSYSYNLAADYERYSTVWYHNLYWYAVEWQDRIVFLAKVMVIAVALWVIVDLVRWLTKRIRAIG